MRERRGVALVVVLWTVAVLATVTALASSAARSSANVTDNQRALATARSMAESGVIAAIALVNDSLSVFASDSVRRDAFLNALDASGVEASGASNPSTSAASGGAAQPLVQDTLADGVFSVVMVDVSARLDVNNSDEKGLTTLWSTVTDAAEARAIATRIARRVRGDDAPTSDAFRSRDDEARATRDSLGAALLGKPTAMPLRDPFESLDELLEIPGVTAEQLATLAPLLSVDGDGSINTRTASATVRRAATGSLVERPTRLLCIARGWQRGHALTREIQAVYELAENGLRLVRWRETTR